MIKHETTALPESPLFCHDIDFKTISYYPRCSEISFGILRDMRDLIDLVIEKDEASCTTYDIKEEDEERTSLTLLSCTSRVSSTR
jgi:hypothetical protein